MNRKILLAIAAATACAAFPWDAWQLKPLEPEGSSRPASRASSHEAVKLAPPRTAQDPASPRRDAAMLAVHHAPALERLQYLLGTKGDGSYATRFEALRLLGRDLKPDELEALYAFVEKTPAPKLKPAEEAALKNDILNLLRNQATPPAGLADLLLKMQADPAQPQVMRDYALQHLSECYGETSGHVEKKRIEAAFWEAAGQTKGSIPGTSMLALYRFAGSNPGIDRARLGQQALDAAGNGACDATVRTTALQVCSLLGVSQAGETAMELVRADGTPAPLKISALAALGDLGGPEAATALKQVAEGNDERLKVPARAALERITKRLGL